MALPCIKGIILILKENPEGVIFDYIVKSYQMNNPNEIALLKVKLTVLISTKKIKKEDNKYFLTK